MTQKNPRIFEETQKQELAKPKKRGEAGQKKTPPDLKTKTFHLPIFCIYIIEI